MSNMATGIPIGLAIGMGSGIATGMASGQSMARIAVAARIREIAATHTLVVQRPDGTALPLEDFISMATAAGGPAFSSGKRSMLWVLLAAGILIVAAAALFIFLRLRA